MTKTDLIDQAAHPAYPTGSDAETRFVEAARQAPVANRAIFILALRSFGWQYQRIGKLYGLSRQRVHQIVKRGVSGL